MFRSVGRVQGLAQARHRQAVSDGDHVPAPDERTARQRLAASSYDGAPVETWPLTGTRYTSRERLVRSLLAPRFLPIT